MSTRHQNKGHHPVYPGKTSTLQIGGLMLTFQTEVGGDPLAITTIVVSKGRTLRTFSEALAKLQLADPERPIAALVEQAHQSVVHRLKLPQSPASAAPSIRQGAAIQTPSVPVTPDPPVEQRAPESTGQATSLLVVRAIEAFDRLDHQTALNLLEAAQSLLPRDARLRRSIARLRELV